MFCKKKTKVIQPMKTWNQLNSKNYEEYCIEYHREKNNHTVWHWNEVPESVLYDSGFIHDFNKVRMRRKEIYEREGRYYNPIREYGLDGISFDQITYHGIQSKLYDENAYLTASDLGSFISVIFCRFQKMNLLSKGYLYYTCKLQVDVKDDFTNASDEMIFEQLPYSEDIQNGILGEIVNDRMIETDLRPYQQEAIEALDKEWDGIRLLNLPCGTGKTVIFCNHVKNKSYKHVFIISPLQVHTKQNLKRMKEFLSSDYEILLLDSDSGGSTDFEDLKETMKGKSIISSTFASAKRVMTQMFHIEETEDEDKEYETEFDLSESILIVDEAHNLGFDENDDLIQLIRSFSKVLLVTATPPSCMEDILECEIVYQYPFQKAIEEKYICDYQIYIPLLVKNEETGESSVMIEKPFEWIDLDDDLAKKCLYLINGMLQTGSKRCIAYLSCQEECDEFQRVFKEVIARYHYLPYWISMITSSVKDRNQIIKDFEKEENHQMDMLKILCSIKILDEGVDIPKCDSIFVSNVSEYGSSIRMVQRMCRANRIIKENPNKIANCFLWTDDMNKILNTLSILKENDIDFYKKIKVMNGDYDKQGDMRRREYIEKENNEIIEYVNVKCIRYMDRWEVKRQLLFKFCEENKRCPTKSEIYNDIRIGKWLQTQKRIMESNNSDIYRKLSINEYVKKSIDYYLENRVVNKKKILLTWDESKNLLFEYCHEFREVPSHSKIYKERHVGLWLQDQKKKIKSVESDIYQKLVENHYVKRSLDEFLGIIDVWEEWKILLFEFCDKNNRICTGSEKYKEKNIGQWYQDQKKKITSNESDIYKKLSLNEYVKDSLDEFLKNKEKNKDKIMLSWDEWKKLLFEFCSEKGRTPHATEKYKDCNLGMWFNITQRRNIKSIESDVYKKLSIIPCVKENLDIFLRTKEENKDKKKISWEKSKMLLFEFCDENRRCPVNEECFRDYNITRWFNDQKAKIESVDSDIYKKLSVNQYVKDALDYYLIKDKILEKKWNKCKNLLFEFCEINNRVPIQIEKYKDESIGDWLRSQKVKIKSIESYIYKELVKNQYVKKSVDDYLSKKKII